MNKCLIVIGMVVLLMCIGLSGCVTTNQNRESSVDGNGSTTPSDED